MKRPLALLLALAFAFLLVNLWRGVRPSSERAEVSAEPTALAPDGPDARSSATAESEVRVPAAPSVGERADEPARAAAKALAVAVGGAFRVRSADGVERSDGEGTFQLLGFDARGDLVFQQRADAAGGRWSAELDAAQLGRAAHFAAALAQHGGRLVPLLSPPEGERVANDGRGFDVVVRVPAPNTLRVVDARTRRDLAQVEVRFATDGHYLEAERERDVLFRGAPSPIDCEGLESRDPRANFQLLQLAVRAPGYAWQLVDIDRRQGGERLVELAPGGDVELALVGAQPPAEARITLSSPGPNTTEPMLRAEFAVEGRAAIRLSGVPARTCQVLLHVGETYDASGHLAHAEFSVLEGARTRVELAVSEPQEIATAELSGVLLVPLSWDGATVGFITAISQFGNVIGAQSERTRILGRWRPESERDSGFETLDFGPETLAVGSYVLAVEGLGLSTPFELPPQGLRGLRIQVGEPCDLELAIVDRDSGERVPSASLSWCVFESDQGYPMTLYSEAERDTADGLFRIRAPAGYLRWLLFAEGYGEPESNGLWLRPGQTRHTLRLERQCALRFLLFDGDAALPFPDGWLPEVEAIGHDGERTTLTYGKLERALGLSRPGRYRVTLPAVNGFRPLEALEVDVLPGEKRELRIELERNPR